MSAIHVIDFEGNRRYGVAEFGVATLQSGEITFVESQLCAIDDARSFSFLGHSRFSPEMTPENKVSRVPFRARLKFFSELRQTGYFCAHHAPTEDRLLRMYSPCSLGGLPWGPWIDTLRLFREHFPKINDYRVRELIRLTGLHAELNGYVEKFLKDSTGQQFHRAGYDALATALLLRYFIQRFRVSSVEFLLQSQFLE